jgi:hypothetical protein
MQRLWISTRVDIAGGGARPDQQPAERVASLFRNAAFSAPSTKPDIAFYKRRRDTGNLKTSALIARAVFITGAQTLRKILQTAVKNITRRARARVRVLCAPVLYVRPVILFNVVRSVPLRALKLSIYFICRSM